MESDRSGFRKEFLTEKSEGAESQGMGHHGFESGTLQMRCSS